MLFAIVCDGFGTCMFKCAGYVKEPVAVAWQAMQMCSVTETLS